MRLLRLAIRSRATYSAVPSSASASLNKFSCSGRRTFIGGSEPQLKNPYAIRDDVFRTQMAGWLDVWDSTPGAYYLKARNGADVAAAVSFAVQNRLRLIVRGGAHSYHGLSNRPDSLLIWTRLMNDVTVIDAFTPQGCKAAPVPAVSVGPGTVQGDVFNTVTVKGKRYVQGGAAPSQVSKPVHTLVSIWAACL